MKIEVSEIVSKWNGDKAIVDQNLKKSRPNEIVKSPNKNEDWSENENIWWRTGGRHRLLIKDQVKISKDWMELVVEKDWFNIENWSERKIFERKWNTK